MRIDIMTDIETLGNKSDSTIIQIAAIAFDIDTGEYLDEFNEVADITKNKRMKVSGSTIKWWLNTDKELFQKLINNGQYSSDEIVVRFHKWLLELMRGDGELYLWGNGILFDNKMIQHQMELNDLDYPIFYRNDRDMRTLVDLASKKWNITEKELKERFNREDLIAHDAYNDVKYQIDLVINCYKILMS